MPVLFLYYFIQMILLKSLFLYIWSFIWGYGYSFVSQSKNLNFYTLVFDILFLNGLIVKNFMTIKYYFWYCKFFWFLISEFWDQNIVFSLWNLEKATYYNIIPCVFFFLRQIWCGQINNLFDCTPKFLSACRGKGFYIYAHWGTGFLHNRWKRKKTNKYS